MRIIAGIYKGFRLQEFPGKDIRPTPSKVREALFDILALRIVESEFLDLFAGTGAVGIEALSRGAKRVTFVDIDRKAIQLIKENLNRIHYHDFSNIIKNDYILALKTLNQQQRKFDIIFLDPPYNQHYFWKSLQAIDKSIILKKESLVIVQHQFDMEIKKYFRSISYLKEKRYGKSSVTIFRHEE